MSGYQIPHFGLIKQYSNLRQELLDATDRALSSGQLVSGSYTKEFEEWLAARCKTKYAVTVHSGTQALEIIARYKKELHEKTLLGIPKIRIPNLTYPATLNAFINAGWEIIIGDTDKYGILNYQQEDSDKWIYQCLVGLYGMKPWHDTPNGKKFGVIVDGAQHWLEAAGDVGSGMAISFDPTKNLNSSGNGGAIVTNDAILYDYALSYRDNYKPYFTNVGTNTKMSEQDCAQILIRTKYITEWQIRRKAISKHWCELFRNLPIRCLADTETPHAHQKFVIYSNDRNVLQEYLLSKGIEVKIHYGRTLGELHVSKKFFSPDLLSTSLMLSRGVITLPLYPELTDNEVDYISDTLHNFYK